MSPWHIKKLHLNSGASTLLYLTWLFGSSSLKILYKAPVDENYERMLLYCFQEKFAKNKEQALKAKNQVIYYVEKYYEDFVEKQHSEAEKEWYHSYHELSSWIMSQHIFCDS